MAIAQKGGREHWNGQPMGQRIYGDVKKVVVLTPDGKGGDGGGDGSDGSDVKGSVGKDGGNGPGGTMDWVGGDGKRDDGSGNKGNIFTNFFSSILCNKFVQKDTALSTFFSSLSTMVPGLGLLLGASSNNSKDEGDKSNATNEDPLAGVGGSSIPTPSSTAGPTPGASSPNDMAVLKAIADAEGTSKYADNGLSLIHISEPTRPY